MTASGKGVAAAEEAEAFAEMIRMQVTGVAERARPDVRVGPDDEVTVTIVVDRREQAAVGAVLERLLQDVHIHSTTIEEDSSQPPPTAAQG